MQYKYIAVKTKEAGNNIFKYNSVQNTVIITNGKYVKKIFSIWRNLFNLKLSFLKGMDQI